MTGEGILRARDGEFHAYRDESLLVLPAAAEIDGSGIGGFYYANTRLLSRVALRIDGRSLYRVQVAPARADLLVAYFQDPHVTRDPVLQDRTLVVQMTVAAGRGFHIDLDVRNHSLAPVECALSLDLDADFADLEEARTGQDASKILLDGDGGPAGRLQYAPVRRICALADARELRFEYQHPHLNEAVRLHFEPAPRCDGDGVVWRLALPPQAGWHACVSVVALHAGQLIRPDARCYGMRRTRSGSASPRQARYTRIETSNDSVRRAADRAIQDLADLSLHSGPAAERPAFAAGIPIYHNAFGRDLLTTSWQAAIATPDLLTSALLVCVRNQGRVQDDFRDEQPGRIFQQVRSGPLNLLNLNPRGRYYSDYAAPADLLIMLGQHFMWTGDREFFFALVPAAEQVLAWLDDAADLDGDGFYEYQTRSPMGDRNQGWKDSEHAVPHADGRDAPLPVATAEVQGYVYAGKQQFGAALLAAGNVRRGLRLLREAASLKRRFNDVFWMPDQSFVAMALDGDKRQVRSLGSNAGHCLAAGIVDARHAAAVAGGLMAPDLFSGWGVRTLSAGHPAYNPFSYHLGSVWPVEQGTIALGMKRYGFSAHANAIASALFDLAEQYQLHRLPEAVGGLPRDRAHPTPGLYPQACWPQAWSGSSVLIAIQAMLGLRPLAPLGVLLVDPDLPSWLPDITLHGLRVGRSTLTLQFRRGPAGGATCRVLQRHGPIRVLRAPPDLSIRHGLGQRLGIPALAALRGGLSVR